MTGEQPEDPPSGGGLDAIREILLGDILLALERRLGRIDSVMANRSNELQHDVRSRTDVLEAHVRRELDSIASRIAQLEQHLGRIEDRLEQSIERIERQGREQMLAQAKTFIDELERSRMQLRSALARELGLEPESEAGVEHAAWAASH